jgi:hypothetical protein
MTKLRADVLRNLPEDDQNLMKVFRKQPIKAYEIKDLLPPDWNVIQHLALQRQLTRLTELKPPLLMQIERDGKTFYMKVTREFLQQIKRDSQEQHHDL